jgi:hypothetical protein
MPLEPKLLDGVLAFGAPIPLLEITGVAKKVTSLCNPPSPLTDTRIRADVIRMR